MKPKLQKKHEQRNAKALKLSHLVKQNDNKRVPKFGVSFFERSEKTLKGRSVIYISATFQARNYKKSLSINCKSGSLDIGTLTIKNDRENSLLLQSIESRVNELVANFRLTGKKIEIKKVIDSVLTQNNIIDRTPDVRQIAEIILDDISQKYELGEITLKSYQRYQMNFERLETFLSGHLNSNFIELSEVNQHTVEKYVRWLKVEYGFQPETIKKALQVGRMIYKVAQQNKWHEYNPFTFVKLQGAKTGIENYITLDEIKKISSLSFDNQIYDDIRDIFIFQCYTSLAYTDVKNLLKSHVIDTGQGSIIRKAREKTNSLQNIFLFPEALEILEKHKERGQEYCFACYSNTHHNRVLKEIAKIAGINKPISTHWGRRTFGQLMVHNGMSKEALQSVFGHSSVRITEKHYVNTSEHRAINEMKSLTSKLS